MEMDNAQLIVAFLMGGGIVVAFVMLVFKLHRQRREFRILFESVPCTISIQDRQYRLIDYNREFTETFDVTQGKHCYAVYKGRTEKCEICPVARTFKDGKPHYSEETRTNKDGTRKYWIVKTAAIRNTHGEIKAAMEMCLDVTHRKELEEELVRSEKKYYAIFNNIPNAVLVLEPEEFKVMDCNKSMETVYGYSPNEVISRSFLDFFSDEEKDHYAFSIRNSEEINNVKHRRKDGKEIFVNIRVSPSEYWDEQVLLVTISDITKRLEAEQQLTQASKMATLGEMATGVAHELNQPLTVIKMASNFFMKKVGHDEEIPPKILLNMTEKINNNIDRANRIINHMRDFARKSDMRLEKVQMNQVIERAYEIFSQQLRLRNIEVIWEIQQNIPVIMADPGRLEQVFINLLINARDAIESVDRGENGGEKRIKIFTGVKDKRVMAQVSDSGCGIPEAVADKIFEPFFTTKEVGKGTGLGLSISYGIVKDFRGDIRATGNEWGGATFIIDFPIYELSQDTQNGRH